jgi:DNA-binding transcriptional MocR family regulator
MQSPESAIEVRDQRQPGWFYVDNEVVDHHGWHLGAYGLAVYCILSRHAKYSTQKVNLSQRDIAKALGISQDRVRKSLRDLVARGLIHVEAPERPSPCLISTITLRKVKQTERPTFGSIPELNASRWSNKEEKNKTKTNIPPNPPSGGLSSRDRRNLSIEMQRMYDASAGANHTEDFADQVLQAACARLTLPLDLAREAVARSYAR